jgi:hypothetical protein
MRISIAFLVVTVPLFVYLIRLVHEDIRRTVAKRDLWVRRWLVVLTLFVAGVTIAADLVTLIYVFLQGELSTRFILKALSFVVLPGAAFWYFLEELKGTWEVRKKQSEIIGIGVVSVVAFLIAGGFMIIGSPFTMRLMQLDNQRINDLMQLQSAVLMHYQQTGIVPASVEELRSPLNNFMLPVDPETTLPYGYSKTGDLSFSLCATFATEGNENSLFPAQSKPVTEEGWYRFKHGMGETCFERPIDPKLYPVIDHTDVKSVDSAPRIP